MRVFFPPQLLQARTALPPSREFSTHNSPGSRALSPPPHRAPSFYAPASAIVPPTSPVGLCEVVFKYLAVGLRSHFSKEFGKCVVCLRYFLNQVSEARLSVLGWVYWLAREG